MHSLRTKITTLTIVAVLISTAFVGLLAVMSMKAEEHKNAQKFMDAICTEECREMNLFADETGPLVRQVSKISILDGGYAFLVGKNGRIVYHRSMPSGVSVTKVSEELADVGSSPQSDRMVRYSFRNERNLAVWQSLSNGMRLVVTVPEDEINAGWRNLMGIMLILASTILGVFILMTFFMAGRITLPLEKLARASRQVAAGNYNVDLKYEEEDEVGILTRSFLQMAEQMETFVGDLNSKAYKDALTSVSNKGAFDVTVYELNERIQNAARGHEPQFALAMFDCNYLKRVNDTYGHEKGDIYLKNACMTVCRVFAHSPVFRVGGDEFAAILRGHDFEHREELEQLLRSRSEQISGSAENPWEEVSIAAGIAEYDPEIDKSIDDVLRRADELMYENKRRMKES